MPNLPDDVASIVRSQIEAWTTELEDLQRDPRVRKYSELRQKIDEADAFVVEPDTRPLSFPSSPFDLYDAFEFARDLTGRDISARELSKLAFGRFPEISEQSRRLMIQYLIDHGGAGVSRMAASGRPTWYRFGSPINRRAFATRKRLGIPESELSAFKSDDLEDLAVRMMPAAVP